MLWVDDTAAYGTNGSSGLMAAVFDKWNGVKPVGSPPAVNLHGQRVSVAQPKNPTAKAGDTQIVAASFEVGVELPKSGTSADDLIGASQPRFYPTMHSVEVDLPGREGGVRQPGRHHARWSSPITT